MIESDSLFNFLNLIWDSESNIEIFNVKNYKVAKKDEI